MRHLYSHALRGYAVRVPNANVLNSILKDPDVTYVQPDVKMKVFSQTLPTGINRVDGDSDSTKSGDGTGVVDVDIAYSRYRNRCLSSRLERLQTSNIRFWNK